MIRGACCDMIGRRGVRGEMSKPITHIAEDGREHDLYEHLAGTAKKTSEFADEFGSGDWAYLVGLLHDLGKYSEGLLL